MKRTQLQELERGLRKTVCDLDYARRGRYRMGFGLRLAYVGLGAGCFVLALAFASVPDVAFACVACTLVGLGFLGAAAGAP